MPTMEQILGDRNFEDLSIWAQTKLGELLSKIHTLTKSDLGFFRSVSTSQIDEYLRANLVHLEPDNMAFIKEPLGGRWTVEIGPMPCWLSIHLAYYDGLVWIARIGTNAFDEFQQAVKKEFDDIETLRGFNLIFTKEDLCHPMSQVFWTYPRQAARRR